MFRFNSNKDDIQFSSDLHAYHKNICYGTSVWENKETSTRRFKDPYHMTQHIIDNINKTSTEDTHLFLLGDLMFHFKSVDSYITLLSRFTSQNIYLLFGNHDNVTNLKEACSELDKIKYLGDYLDIYVDKLLVCLFHYPIENWNTRFGRAVHLHGHTHGTLPEKKDRLDVGVDNAYNIFKKYQTFSWKDVKNSLS